MPKGCAPRSCLPSDRAIPYSGSAPHGAVSRHADALWVQHHNGIFVRRIARQAGPRIIATRRNRRPLALRTRRCAIVRDADGLVLLAEGRATAGWRTGGDDPHARWPVRPRQVAPWSAAGTSPTTSSIVTPWAFIDDSGERLLFGSTTSALWISEDGGENFGTLSAHLPPIYCVRLPRPGSYRAQPETLSLRSRNCVSTRRPRFRSGLAGGAQPCTLGSQILADLYDCARDTLDDPQAIQAILVEAAPRCPVPPSSTALLPPLQPARRKAASSLSESHLSVHTWPGNTATPPSIYLPAGSSLRPDDCFAYLRAKRCSANGTRAGHRPRDTCHPPPQPSIEAQARARDPDGKPSPLTDWQHTLTEMIGPGACASDQAVTRSWTSR